MPNINVTDARVKAEGYTEQTMRDALATYREALATHHLTVDQPAPTAPPFIEMLHQRLGAAGELFVVPEPENEGETPNDTHDENGVPYKCAKLWAVQALEVLGHGLDFEAFIDAAPRSVQLMWRDVSELDRRAKSVVEMWAAYPGSASLDLATVWIKADELLQAEFE